MRWMCPTDPAGWQFLGLLASTGVVNRLGKLAVDTATGDQDSASATWWLSLHGTPDHAPTRAKAKEAFAQPETPLGRSPSRERPNALLRRANVAPSAGAVAAIGSPGRAAPERGRIVAAMQQAIDNGATTAVALEQIAPIAVHAGLSWFGSIDRNDRLRRRAADAAASHYGGGCPHSGRCLMRAWPATGLP